MRCIEAAGKREAAVESLAELGGVEGDRLRVDAGALRLQIRRVLNGSTPAGQACGATGGLACHPPGGLEAIPARGRMRGKRTASRTAETSRLVPRIRACLGPGPP